MLAVAVSLSACRCMVIDAIKSDVVLLSTTDKMTKDNAGSRIFNVPYSVLCTVLQQQDGVSFDSVENN